MEEEEEERVGEEDPGSGEAVLLINQSHQLSGLTKTRDPRSLEGWGQDGDVDKYHRLEVGEEGLKERAAASSEGPASGPPNNRCVGLGEGV